MSSNDNRSYRGNGDDSMQSLFLKTRVKHNDSKDKKSFNNTGVKNGNVNGGSAFDKLTDLFGNGDSKNENLSDPLPTSFSIPFANSAYYRKIIQSSSKRLTLSKLKIKNDMRAKIKSRAFPLSEEESELTKHEKEPKDDLLLWMETLKSKAEQTLKENAMEEKKFYEDLAEEERLLKVQNEIKDEEFKKLGQFLNDANDEENFNLKNVSTTKVPEIKTDENMKNEYNKSKVPEEKHFAPIKQEKEQVYEEPEEPEEVEEIEEVEEVEEVEEEEAEEEEEEEEENMSQDHFDEASEEDAKSEGSSIEVIEIDDESESESDQYKEDNEEKIEENDDYYSQEHIEPQSDIDIDDENDECNKSFANIEVFNNANDDYSVSDESVEEEEVDDIASGSENQPSYQRIRYDDYYYQGTNQLQASTSTSKKPSLINSMNYNYSSKYSDDNNSENDENIQSDVQEFSENEDYDNAENPVETDQEIEVIEEESDDVKSESEESIDQDTDEENLEPQNLETSSSQLDFSNVENMGSDALSIQTAVNNASLAINQHNNYEPHLDRVTVESGAEDEMNLSPSDDDGRHDENDLVDKVHAEAHANNNTSEIAHPATRSPSPISSSEEESQEVGQNTSVLNPELLDILEHSLEKHDIDTRDNKKIEGLVSTDILENTIFPIPMLQKDVSENAELDQKKIKSAPQSDQNVVTDGNSTPFEGRKSGYESDIEFSDRNVNKEQDDNDQKVSLAQDSMVIEDSNDNFDQEHNLEYAGPTNDAITEGSMADSESSSDDESEGITGTEFLSFSDSPNMESIEGKDALPEEKYQETEMLVDDGEEHQTNSANSQVESEDQIDNEEFHTGSEFPDNLSPDNETRDELELPAELLEENVLPHHTNDDTYTGSGEFFDKIISEVDHKEHQQPEVILSEKGESSLISKIAADELANTNEYDGMQSDDREMEKDTKPNASPKEPENSNQKLSADVSYSESLNNTVGNESYHNEINTLLIDPELFGISGTPNVAEYKKMELTDNQKKISEQNLNTGDKSEGHKEEQKKRNFDEDIDNMDTDNVILLGEKNRETNTEIETQNLLVTELSEADKSKSLEVIESSEITEPMEGMQNVEQENNPLVFSNELAVELTGEEVKRIHLDEEVILPTTIETSPAPISHSAGETENIQDKSEKEQNEESNIEEEKTEPKKSSFFSFQSFSSFFFKDSVNRNFDTTPAASDLRENVEFASEKAENKEKSELESSEFPKSEVEEIFVSTENKMTEFAEEVATELQHEADLDTEDNNNALHDSDVDLSAHEETENRGLKRKAEIEPDLILNEVQPRKFKKLKSFMERFFNYSKPPTSHIEDSSVKDDSARVFEKNIHSSGEPVDAEEMSNDSQNKEPELNSDRASNMKMGQEEELESPTFEREFTVSEETSHPQQAHDSTNVIKLDATGVDITGEEMQKEEGERAVAEPEDKKSEEIKLSGPEVTSNSNQLPTKKTVKSPTMEASPELTSSPLSKFKNLLFGIPKSEDLKEPLTEDIRSDRLEGDVEELKTDPIESDPPGVIIHDTESNNGNDIPDAKEKEIKIKPVAKRSKRNRKKKSEDQKKVISAFEAIHRPRTRKATNSSLALPSNSDEITSSTPISTRILPKVSGSSKNSSLLGAQTIKQHHITMRTRSGKLIGANTASELQQLIEQEKAELKLIGEVAKGEIKANSSVSDVASEYDEEEKKFKFRASTIPEEKEEQKQEEQEKQEKQEEQEERDEKEEQVKQEKQEEQEELKPRRRGRPKKNTSNSKVSKPETAKSVNSNSKKKRTRRGSNRKSR